MKTGKANLMVEFQPPTATKNVVFALVSINWTMEEDTWDLPGSFNWQYDCFAYADIEGRMIERPEWLDEKTLESGIQKEFDFLDLED